MNRIVLWSVAVCGVVTTAASTPAEACHRRRCCCGSNRSESGYRFESGYRSESAYRTEAAPMNMQQLTEAVALNLSKGSKPVNGPQPMQPQPLAMDNSAIDARLNRIEDLLGLPHTASNGEVGLGGGLIAALVGDAIRDVAPDLILELRNVTRKRFGLPAVAAPAPAPSSPPASSPGPALTLADLTAELKKHHEGLKKDLPSVMLKALEDPGFKKNFQDALK
jgi:hypothetical protein